MLTGINKSFLYTKAGLHTIFCATVFLITATMVLLGKNSYLLLERGIIVYAFVLCGIYAGRSSVKKWFLYHNTMHLIIYSGALIAVLSIVFAAYWDFFINENRHVHVELLSISIPLVMIFMFIGSFVTLVRAFINQRKDRTKVVPVQRVNTLHDANSAREDLFIKTSGKVYKVAFNELLYAEANGNYTKVITSSSLIMHKLPFSSFEELLPDKHFARIHRSFIINKSKISHIEGNRVFIGKYEIPIGRNFKKSFFDLMGL